jgi:hypothetical protein
MERSAASDGEIEGRSPSKGQYCQPAVTAPCYAPHMKHATPTALDALEPLLEQLRAVPGLIERKRGVFYRRSSAFLHFHEDPAGFFADLKTGPAWTRLPASSPKEKRALLAAVRSELAAKR